MVPNVWGVIACLAVLGAACSSDPDTQVAATTFVVDTTFAVDTTVPISAMQPRSHDAATARCAPGDAAEREVVVWHALSTDTALAAFSNSIARFETERPGITVKLVAAGGYRQLLANLRTAPATELPDLAMIQAEMLPLFAKSPSFLPPSICTGGTDPAVLDDLLPVIRATYTFDGQLWTYPFNPSTPVMLYDSAMFARAGLNPDAPPDTPEKLRTTVELLVASGEAQGGLALYDRSAGWLIEQWAVHHGNTLLTPDNGAGGAVVDSVEFATDEAVEDLTWARNMYVDGLVTWVGANLSGIDDLLQSIYLSNGSSITFHTSESVGDVLDLLYESNIDDLAGIELGVAPLPGPVPGSGALVGGGAWLLVDNADPARVHAGAELAEFLMQPDVLGPFAGATGVVPATRSAASDPVLQARWVRYPQLEVAFRQLENLAGSPVQRGMQIGPRIEIQRILERAAALIILEGADPHETLHSAEREAIALLRAYSSD